jgi:hypothetical protein
MQYKTGDSQFRNLHVLRNGIGIIPGSGTSSSDENYNDYREGTFNSIVTNRDIGVGEVLEFRTFCTNL